MKQQALSYSLIFLFSYFLNPLNLMLPLLQLLRFSIRKDDLRRTAFRYEGRDFHLLPFLLDAYGNFAADALDGARSLFQISQLGADAEGLETGRSRLDATYLLTQDGQGTATPPVIVRSPA